LLQFVSNSTGKSKKTPPNKGQKGSKGKKQNTGYRELKLKEPIISVENIPLMPIRKKSLDYEGTIL